MKLTLFGYSLEIDQSATIAAYTHMPPDCICAYCENFRATYDRLPQIILDALHELGADPSKPSEIIDYCSNSDNSHYYEAWYHVVGRIIQEKEVARDKFGMTVLGDGASVHITSKLDLLPEHFPEPAIQVDIFCNLPWVIPVVDC